MDELKERLDTRETLVDLIVRKLPRCDTQTLRKIYVDVAKVLDRAKE